MEERVVGREAISSRYSSASQQPTLDASSEKETEQTKQKALPPRRILVVDDNRDARESLATLLRGLGYSVETARDSASALETAASFLPQVVILDIIMPGVSGFRTAELMRQQPLLHNIVIITVTGWQETLDDWLSKNAGCNYHLLKPLDMERLETILQKYLPS
jgi:CheY-like chemotaxis protein